MDLGPYALEIPSPLPTRCVVVSVQTLDDTSLDIQIVQTTVPLTVSVVSLSAVRAARYLQL